MTDQTTSRTGGQLVAECLRLHGVDTEQFAAAFERALGAGRAALLELRVDGEAITPKTTLTAIREAALKRREAALKRPRRS
jgi:hypothetical protein